MITHHFNPHYCHHSQINSTLSIITITTTKSSIISKTVNLFDPLGRMGSVHLNITHAHHGWDLKTRQHARVLKSRGDRHRLHYMFCQ
jgi:hypothetical protein